MPSSAAMPALTQAGGRARWIGLALCAVVAGDAAAVASDTYRGVACHRPSGYRVVDCRLAPRGTPDLSRLGFARAYGEELTIGRRIHGLAPNPRAGGTRRWPLIDSLGRPMGRLAAREDGHFTLYDLAGRAYRVTLVNLRGHGCAARRRQRRRYPLVQIVAIDAPASGTQAFIDEAAIDRSRPENEAAFAAFAHQRGGGNGCGVARRPTGRFRPLADPAVGAVAHARLGNGELNTVTEYDAKRRFGDVVYFSANTTEVHAGGIARGMVRVGTPVAVADAFRYCDPNSDGTLIWRYVAIHTGFAGRPRVYGWIPGRCPQGLRTRLAPSHGWTGVRARFGRSGP